MHLSACATCFVGIALPVTNTELHCPLALPQVWQVHTWLIDRARMAPGRGLEGGLNFRVPRELLEAAKNAQDFSAAKKDTLGDMHMDVLTRLLFWLSDISINHYVEQPIRWGGELLADIIADYVPSCGRIQLAYEVNDSSRYVAVSGAKSEAEWPERGETAARQRTLASRGYAVVVIPFWAWEEPSAAVAGLSGILPQQQEQLLRVLIERAVRALPVCGV